MAKIVDNKKGFKVIKMNSNEAKSLNWGISNDGLCICMSCNKAIRDSIYYIAVLKDVMDYDCYKKWLHKAHNYPEDRPFELKAFNEVKEKLNIK